MASKIKTIQSDIEAKVETFFPEGGVTVLSRLRGNVTNDVLATIAKKQMAILVFPPSIGGIKANVLSGARAEDCRMQLRVVENPLMNAGVVDAYEAAERLLTLNGFKTSTGDTVFLASVEDASPDNAKVREFVIELKMALNFERYK